MTAKPLDKFYKSKNAYGTLWRDCKECVIIKQRQKITGITEKEYQRLFVLQKGLCAICKCVQKSSRYSRFAADHCHKTKRIRGLLCNNCNTALGLLKDDPTRLLAAVAYLAEDIV